MRRWDEESQVQDEFEESSEDSCDGEVILDTEPAMMTLAEQEFARWLRRRRANQMLIPRTREDGTIKYSKPAPGNGTGRPGH